MIKFTGPVTPPPARQLGARDSAGMAGKPRTECGQPKILVDGVVVHVFLEGEENGGAAHVAVFPKHRRTLLQFVRGKRPLDRLQDIPAARVADHLTDPCPLEVLVKSLHGNRRLLWNGFVEKVPELPEPIYKAQEFAIFREMEKIETSALKTRSAGVHRPNRGGGSVAE